MFLRHKPEKPTRINRKHRHHSNIIDFFANPSEPSLSNLVNNNIANSKDTASNVAESKINNNIAVEPIYAQVKKKSERKVKDCKNINKNVGNVDVDNYRSKELKESQASGSTEAESRPCQQIWPCPQCTLENKCHAEKCEVCEFPNKGFNSCKHKNPTPESDESCVTEIGLIQNKELNEICNTRNINEDSKQYLTLPRRSKNFMGTLVTIQDWKTEMKSVVPELSEHTVDRDSVDSMLSNVPGMGRLSFNSSHNNLSSMSQQYGDASLHSMKPRTSKSGTLDNKPDAIEDPKAIENRSLLIENRNPAEKTHLTYESSVHFSRNKCRRSFSDNISKSVVLPSNVLSPVCSNKLKQRHSMIEPLGVKENGSSSSQRYSLYENISSETTTSQRLDII